MRLLLGHTRQFQFLEPVVRRAEDLSPYCALNFCPLRSVKNDVSTTYIMACFAAVMHANRFSSALYYNPKCAWLLTPPTSITYSMFTATGALSTNPNLEYRYLASPSATNVT